MTAIKDLCTFDPDVWHKHKDTDYLVTIDDSRRLYFRPDLTPAQVWVYLSGRRIAVVRDGESPSIQTIPEKVLPGQAAEADALIAEVRAGFGLASV